MRNDRIEYMLQRKMSMKIFYEQFDLHMFFIYMTNW